MRYMGGKSRLGKKIAAILKTYQRGRPYWEPFCGSCAVMEHMTGARLASDAQPYLIALLKAVQDGYEPPANVSEEQYKLAKQMPHLFEDHEIGFIGFGASFAAKWFGGYARGGGRNFVDESRRSLLKQKPKLADVTFCHSSYEDMHPMGAGVLIYCDPPYAGTTTYKGVQLFDSERFWRRAKEWSQDHTVIVSEYTCPLPEAKEIAAWPVKTSLTKDYNENSGRVEKLFLLGA